MTSSPVRDRALLPAARLVLLAPLTLALAAQAAPSAECRPWRERREALAGQAMAAEIALVRRLRQRLCPKEEEQAAGANADERRYGVIDYSALIACRQQAETELKRDWPVLYRNRRGFVFYTSQGAALARQADGVEQQGRDRGCP